MHAYYNEIEPYAAQWLRNLITAGHIPDGIVDERDIRLVQPSDLRDFTQCHFFAGIAGWSLALQFARWPTDRPVWTGSCPCQPFSTAGRRKGVADDRHLWPEWFRLIEQCRPPVVFGEQVASPDGLKWLDLVCADLEGANYAVGAADLCAAGVGAPHLRQRLWFVADAGLPKSSRRECEEDLDAGPSSQRQDGSCGDVLASRGGAGNMADPEYRRPQSGNIKLASSSPSIVASDCCLGSWAVAEFIECSDGRRRPAQPGILPLAHGVPGRVGKLRAYGNAIVPQVAAEVIKAFMSCKP